MDRIVRMVVVFVAVMVLAQAPTGCGSGRDGERWPPDAPARVTATSPGAGDVVVSWDAVTGATAYNLYWSMAPGVTKATGTVIADVTAPYLHTGRVAGTTYYYFVTARSGGGESVESSEVSATPDTLGVLDTTFGGQGWVTDLGAAGGSGKDYGEAIAVDASGRILVAGSSGNSARNVDMAIWRFNADGTPDTSFNGQGWAVHAGPPGATGEDGAGGIALDTFGRIVVGGWLVSTSGDYDLAVWRFNSDGSLDTSFNGQGWVVHDNAAGGGPNSDDWAWRVVLDDFDRIVAAGYSQKPGLDGDMVIWRFNEDGNLDTSFNSQGWVVHDGAAGGFSEDEATGVVLDPSGRIVVTGRSVNSAGDLDMVIWRYLEDGALDTTFDGRGWVTHDQAAGGQWHDDGWGIALDSTGRILVTGRSWGEAAVGYDMVIWAYDPTGSLDPTFGSGGIMTHHSAAGGDGSDFGWAIAVDSSDRILVAGESCYLPTDYHMALWRCNWDGTLDTTFNGKGWVVHDNAGGGNGWDWSEAVAIDPLGRLLVAGGTEDLAGNTLMAAWRYK